MTASQMEHRKENNMERTKNIKRRNINSGYK
jgi:hypothetical protein